MRNKALTVPFVLWAMIFIVVPLIMIVWYGVTVEETPAYTEVVLEDGATYFQLEDGTLTAERHQKSRFLRSLRQPDAYHGRDRRQDSQHEGG